MGNCCFPIRLRRTASAVNPKNVTLLLLGLDNAGKTTIAKRLAEEPIDSVVPTVGFSVILLRQKDCHVSIYDLGGGPQIRDIWPRYYADAHGVIFVVDAQDVQKIEECRPVLQNFIRHNQISGKPLLLLANKQDLEGALDEIDVVDRLDLESLVNEQKCPTLVELCSALNFSKKMDIGIDNGYKWLIRSIVKDYPLLNDRVLKDLAKQEEENRVHVIKRQKERITRQEEDGESIRTLVNANYDPFKPVKKILEEKGHLNGMTKTGAKNRVVKIPGSVDEIPEKEKERKSQFLRFLREEMVSVPEPPSKATPKSYSSEFFIKEQFQSDLELLNDVPNQTFKNFLVRPRSSGARLYGVKSEKKKTRRRHPLKKSNKTGPSPFTDFSKESNQVPKALLKKSSEETINSSREQYCQKLPVIPSVDIVDPFLVADRERILNNKPNVGAGESKSTPNSRKNSVNLGTKRRHSMANGKLLVGSSGMELSLLKVSNRLASREVLLDVTQLDN